MIPHISKIAHRDVDVKPSVPELGQPAHSRPFPVSSSHFSFLNPDFLNPSSRSPVAVTRSHPAETREASPPIPGLYSSGT
jgi:hypothetical protein